MDAVDAVGLELKAVVVAEADDHGVHRPHCYQDEHELGIEQKSFSRIEMF